jgi:predicted membrane protein
MANNLTDANAEILMSWDFLEFEQYQRTKSWYITFVLVIGVLLAIAVYQVNFLFAVIVIIAAITFVHVAGRNPRTLTFSISKNGIFINDSFVSYRQLACFYLISNQQISKLFIDFKSIAKPRLAIALKDEHQPEEIKKIMRQFLPENEEREVEPLSEAIVRWLKL